MKRIFNLLAVTILSLSLASTGYCAWDETKPADNEKLKDTPALLRANWDAIKLGTDPDLLITNDKVSPTAAIADTKLAQITTASKVSTSAITGTLPIANGGTGLTTAGGTANRIMGTTNGSSFGLLQVNIASAMITGTLPIANGGTGLTTAGGVANRVLLTTDGSAFATGQVGLTNMVTGTLPVDNGGTGATAAANAANGVCILDANARVATANLGSGSASATTFLAGDQSYKTITTTPGAGTVTSTMLKTAMGEVSSTTAAQLTLPGGEYGFYPQIKKTGGSGTPMGSITISGDSMDVTSYTTAIAVQPASGYRLYAQQRYVTASGTDMWIFLLIDKETKEILSVYQAPDHPAYGNGGDFNKLPHPFGKYDSVKQEIVLVEEESCLAIKAESKQTGKSIATLINEEYRPDMNKVESYKPLHSGKFIDNDTQTHVKEMVSSIPNYIKVRKLIKK